MSAVHELRAARDTLAGLVRDQRWELRRSEAALAATIEAISLLEHDPVLRAISATTDDLARSADNSAVFCTAAPAVTSADVVANPDNTPDDTPDIVPASDGDEITTCTDDEPFEQTRPAPTVQRRTRAGGPDWQAIADVIAAHQPADGPLQQVLQTRFGAPRSATKNWPRVIKELGLVGDPTRVVASPVPPRPASTSGRTVRALMCTSCDTWIPVSAGNAAVKLAHHIRHAHDRAITRPEQTPVDVPIDTEAAS